MNSWRRLESVMSGAAAPRPRIDEAGVWPFARIRMRALWLGDPGAAAMRLCTEAPGLNLTVRLVLPSDELERLVERPGPEGPHAFDLLVLDATSTDIPVRRVLQAIASRALDLPVVLLVREWRADVDAEARALPSCDYVVKTDGYVHQLLPVLAGALSRAGLARALREGRDRAAALAEQHAAERKAAETLWVAEADRYRALLEASRLERDRLEDALREAEILEDGCRLELQLALSGLARAIDGVECQLRPAGGRPAGPDGDAVDGT